MQLSPIEARILGCLLEKERTTPEQYPLSLNALVNACNQSTNREPVVSYDEKTVEQGLDSLRQKQLAASIWSAGSRVQKFRHNLLEIYDLNPADTAILTVLLLRGPQTPGELRQRTERMRAFRDTQEVETCLEGLMVGQDPLAALLPQRPGQKEARYTQLLSANVPETAPQPAIPTAPPSASSRIDRVESQINELQEEMSRLREDFAAFRKQFE